MVNVPHLVYVLVTQDTLTEIVDSSNAQRGAVVMERVTVTEHAFAMLVSLEKHATSLTAHATASREKALPTAIVSTVPASAHRGGVMLTAKHQYASHLQLALAMVYV